MVGSSILSEFLKLKHAIPLKHETETNKLLRTLAQAQKKAPAPGVRGGPRLPLPPYGGVWRPGGGQGAGLGAGAGLDWRRGGDVAELQRLHQELLLSQHRRQHDQPGHDLAKPASCGPRPSQERAKDQAKAEECACCVCGGPASFMCSGCKGSHYCSTECQVSCRQCDIAL